MQLTNPKNSETITSPFATDKAAADALLERINAGEFPKTDFAFSIWSKSKSSSFSDGQRFWLHKLAMPKVAPAPVAQISMSGVKDLLSKAHGKLKKPAIALQTPEGDKVKVYIASDKARYPGSVMVCSPRYGGPYYGRITDGNFFAGRDSKPSVVKLLQDLASDPAGVAAAYGHKTGCCCFCSRQLDDARSVRVGYGPVCAERYGLPWGATAGVPEVDGEAEVADIEAEQAIDEHEAELRYELEAEARANGVEMPLSFAA